MKNMLFLVLLIADSVIGFGQQYSLQNLSASKPVIGSEVRDWTKSPQSRKSKPMIDSTAVCDWISLDNGQVWSSDDGNYIAYTISYLNNKVHGAESLVVKSTREKWNSELVGVWEGLFSSDSREFIFQRQDTLYFLHLGVDTLKWVAGISSYKGTGRRDIFNGAEWVAWQLKGDGHELVLRQPANRKELHFSSVMNYGFDEGGHVMVMEREENTGFGAEDVVERLNLSDGSISKIWLGMRGKRERILGYGLDRTGDQVSLSVQEEVDNKWINTLWYYKTGMKVAEEKVKGDEVERKEGLHLDGGAGNFSPDGRFVYIWLQEPPMPKAPAGAEQVDVWSYRDTVLQSVQLHRLDRGSYMAVFGVESGRVVRLEGDHDRVVSTPELGDEVMVKHNDREDRFWLKGGQLCELVSMKDGTRKEIRADYNSDFWFSPGGRWLIYYRAGDCYSYDLNSGRIVKISEGIPQGWLNWYSDIEGENLKKGLAFPMGQGAWLRGDSGLVIYDEYDLWQVDPSGRKSPVNITHGYGRRHHTKFRLVDEVEGYHNGLPEEEPLLLTAFNTVTKYNGFYRVKAGRSQDPTRVVMGPWDLSHQGGSWFFPENSGDFDLGLPPIRLGKANRWLLRRSSPTEAPNYYVTEDWNSYRAVTDYEPQHGYNWLTTELVTYPQLDGSLSQGVLYKPEDFDRNKKYPIIVQYYEQFSNRVYEYPTPDFTRGHIDIAWFVSHGYLVFTPDIHYKLGYPGASVLNAVEGAGRYLSKLPYVDGRRMGINGHSWGGYETYYLVTHSHLFAAALAGAGGSGSGDWISASFSLAKHVDEGSLVMGRELKMGATLWERPDIYLSNSPVMRADRVTTPLLMFHCKRDEGWEQGVEMMLALRRLGKRSWLLQYDHGSHGVTGRDCVDYTIRVQQFFDYYLKGAPPPMWMTQGVPARFKGIDSGIELDYSGKKP